MKKTFIGKLLFALVFLCTNSFLEAQTTVTFDNQGWSNQSDITSALPSVDGYAFRYFVNGSVQNTGVTYLANNGYSGGAIYPSSNQSSVLTVTKVGGGDFSFESFRVFYGSGASGLTIQGYDNGSSVGAAQVSNANLSGFYELVTLSGDFSYVDSVRITDNSGANGFAAMFDEFKFGNAYYGPRAYFGYVSPSTLSCYGNTNATVGVYTQNMTSPYQYIWSTGDTVNTTSSNNFKYNMGAGTYTVTVTDANGIVDIVDTTISQPDMLGTLASEDASATCNGYIDGAAHVAVTGGTAPYTYLWSNGATTDSITGVANKYYVSVTDNNGCSTVDSVIVNNTQNLTATFSIDATNMCYGQSNNAVSVVVNNGNTPYSYQWSTGATTTALTGLSDDTYSLTVTDNNGCELIDSVDVYGPGELNITTPEVIAYEEFFQSSTTYCQGTPQYDNWKSFRNSLDPNNTSYQGIRISGTNDSIQLWDAAIANQLADALNSGYNLTLYDGNGVKWEVLTGCYQSGCVDASDAVELQVNVSSTGCYCNDGFVIRPAAGSPFWGGLGGFRCYGGNQSIRVEFILEDPVVVSDISCNGLTDGSMEAFPLGGTAPFSYSWSTGGTASSISNLAAGVYSLTVTDANGCSATLTDTVFEPALLSVSDSLIAGAACYGQENGSATASITGGTPAYQYAWSNGDSTEIITAGAGTYSVTVTDASGCTGTTSVTINQPNQITTSTSVVLNQSCAPFNDGEVAVSASGGNGAFTYLWSNGALTATASGLEANTYFVTVTDTNNCSLSDSIVLPVNTVVTGTINIDSTVTCHSLSDGGATVVPSNGVAPYTYLWSNAATTASITGVISNDYTVTVTDNNGCQSVSTAVITEPNPLSVTEGPTLVFEETFTQNVTYCPGDPQYDNWVALRAALDPDNQEYVRIKISGTLDATGVEITDPVKVQALIHAWKNGYDHTETDNGLDWTIGYGCNAAYCNNGSDAIELNAISGTNDCACSPGPILRPCIGNTNWGGLGSTTCGAVTQTMRVEVQEAAPVEIENVSCYGFADGTALAIGGGGTTPYSFNWSTGATIDSIGGLDVGTYSVTITDANGCWDSTSIAITEPDTLIATAGGIDETCYGYADGVVGVGVTGGTEAYAYSWSNGDMQDTINVTNGNYGVTVTDANGCTDTSSVSISGPNQIMVSTVLDSAISCTHSGGFTASATGDNSPFTYFWSNFSSGASVTDIAVVGTYFVVVTDANGCREVAQAVMTEDDLVAAAVVVDSNVTCNGLLDGGATASGSGGTTPYTYLWSNAATTASITGVSAGTYSVTITDNNGCYDSTSATVTEPALLVAAAQLDSNITCNGLSDGGATSAASGGTQPYAYLWSNGATTASITGVTAGTYSVTISDGAGCYDSASVVITEPAALQALSVVDSNITCNGLADGGATSAASGGTQPYAYLWSNSATTASITGVTAGTYTVTITDANGCTSTSSSTVTEPAALLVATVVDSNVTCNGLVDGGATGSASGGTMPYTYVWSNSATTASITGVVAGTYTVTITDASGCADTSSSTVLEPAVLTVTVNVDSNESCTGTANGGLTAQVTGGTAAYNYVWSNAATTASNANLSAGVYSVTITDAKGCTTTDFDTIKLEDVTAPTVVTQNTIAYLNANGEASITPATIDNGSYDACGIDTMYLDNYDFTCSEVGSNTVTLYVTDVNGNTDMATATVTVMDTVSPTVMAQNVTIYLDANGQASITTATVDNGSSDNCNIQSYALDSTDFDCSEVGTNTVTLTVTDVNGNVSSANATVTVMDTISPTVMTQNVTVYLDANGQASITTATINNGSSDNCSIQSYALDSTNFDCGEVGANTVTLTVTDVNGNVSSANATVTVMDTISPIVVTQNVTVYLDANGQASITTATIDNGSSDNCTIQSYALDSTMFDCSEVGANTVTLTVTDVNGNVSSANATVTVMDTIYPVLMLDVDASICATGTSGAMHTYMVSGSDNCSTGGVIQTSGLPSGSTFPIGTTMNVFEITDASGNTTIDSFLVEVYDFPVLVIDSLDLMCETDDPVALSATPVGGTFSGGGVSGSTFDPTAVSAGANMITYTYTTTEGCTYSTVSYVQVRMNPDVYMGSFEDTICLEETVVACPVGTPSGGVYSGAGIDSIVLYTADAGVGQHYITYTYTDQYGCTSSDSTLANIVQCLDGVGIKGLNANGGFEFVVYPNPNRGRFTFKHNSSQLLDCTIYSSDGKLVKAFTVNQKQEEVTFENQAEGLYMMRITGDGIYEFIQFMVY